MDGRRDTTYGVVEKYWYAVGGGHPDTYTLEIGNQRVHPFEEVFPTKG